MIMTDIRDDEEMARIDDALDEFFEAAVSMGGTLSGKHGIGIAKKKYMPFQFKAASLNLMQGIKKTFDPNNILNPGSFL